MAGAGMSGRLAAHQAIHLRGQNPPITTKLEPRQLAAPHSRTDGMLGHAELPRCLHYRVGRRLHLFLKHGSKSLSGFQAAGSMPRSFFLYNKKKSP
jgi:hypothetical protein